MLEWLGLKFALAKAEAYLVGRLAWWSDGGNGIGVIGPLTGAPLLYAVTSRVS